MKSKGRCKEDETERGRRKIEISKIIKWKENAADERRKNKAVRGK